MVRTATPQLTWAAASSGQSSQDPGEGSGRLGRTSQRLERHSEAGVIAGHLRPRRQGRLDQADGLRRATLLLPHHAQQAPCVGVAGILGQGRLVEPRRSLQIACMMQP